MGGRRAATARRVEISEAELQDCIRLQAGSLRDVTVNLYAVVRDEMFFMPAFLRHYRRLGVEQFIILDDGSSDGTRALLEDQRDCVVLTSQFSFGEVITVASGGQVRSCRAGQLFKEAIPRKYLMGKYALYVDADEFLVLPDEVDGLAGLIDRLSERKIESVAASLVEFYPPSWSDLEEKVEPRSFADLVAAYPCFDGVPLLAMQPGQQPRQANPTASKRLFRRCGITEPPSSLAWLPGRVAGLLPFRSPHCPWMKTPLIHWSDDVRLVDSHRANIPPSPDVVLALGHFKFTCDLARRVEVAMRRKTHARGSLKYFQYHRLLQKMNAGAIELAGAETRFYEGPGSLEAVGLITWPS